MPVRKAAPQQAALPSIAERHIPPAILAATRGELVALETIIKFLSQRPPIMADDPFVVPGELFLAGRAEMASLMKARGFPLPVSVDCPYENFLLLGKVIVQGDTHDGEANDG